jgi:hypothetical protein
MGRAGGVASAKAEEIRPELEPAGEGEAVEGVPGFDVGAAPFEVVVGAAEVVFGLGEEGERAEIEIEAGEAEVAGDFSDESQVPVSSSYSASLK